MPNRIDTPDENRLSARTIRKAVPLLWGVALCCLVTLAALTIQAVEVGLVGHPYIEAIVIAILLGTAIRAGEESLAATLARADGEMYSVRAVTRGTAQA